jgi:hypothetical protein
MQERVLRARVAFAGEANLESLRARLQLARLLAADGRLASGLENAEAVVRLAIDELGLVHPVVAEARVVVSALRAKRLEDRMRRAQRR